MFGGNNGTSNICHLEVYTIHQRGERKEVIMTDFDLEALERALSTKERRKKKGESPRKRRSPDKPLWVPVDKDGNPVDPKDMKEGKTYGLKYNE
jgi:hypothetical protein